MSVLKMFEKSRKVVKDVLQNATNQPKGIQPLFNSTHPMIPILSIPVPLMTQHLQSSPHAFSLQRVNVDTISNSAQMKQSKTVNDCYNVLEKKLKTHIFSAMQFPSDFSLFRGHSHTLCDSAALAARMARARAIYHAGARPQALQLAAHNCECTAFLSGARTTNAVQTRRAAGNGQERSRRGNDFVAEETPDLALRGKR